MVLQIVEYYGFEHIVCVLTRHGNYIKLSGVYQKKQSG